MNQKGILCLNVISNHQGLNSALLPKQYKFISILLILWGDLVSYEKKERINICKDYTSSLHCKFGLLLSSHSYKKPKAKFRSSSNQVKSPAWAVVCELVLSWFCSEDAVKTKLIKLPKTQVPSKFGKDQKSFSQLKRSNVRGYVHRSPKHMFRGYAELELQHAIYSSKLVQLTLKHTKINTNVMYI